MMLRALALVGLLAYMALFTFAMVRVQIGLLAAVNNIDYNTKPLENNK